MRAVLMLFRINEGPTKVAKTRSVVRSHIKQFCRERRGAEAAVETDRTAEVLNAQQPYRWAVQTRTPSLAFRHLSSLKQGCRKPVPAWRVLSSSMLPYTNVWRIKSSIKN